MDENFEDLEIQDLSRSGMEGIRITRDGADFILFKVEKVFLHSVESVAQFLEFLRPFCQFPFVIIAQSGQHWIQAHDPDIPEAVKAILPSIDFPSVKWQWIEFG